MQNHFPPWGTISIMPPAQWGSGFQPAIATLTISTMNYLNLWGNQNVKNLLFCLLSLALKAGPKNVSGFLQAIWKSIFISSHRTPFANASLASGTPCSSQSLQWRALPNWQRMGCEQLASISLPRKVIVMGPESMALERREPAQQGATGHPFWATHCSPLFLLNFSPYPFPREKSNSINTPAAVTHLNVKGRGQRQWNHEVSFLICFIPNTKPAPPQWLTSISGCHHYLNSLISPDLCLIYLIGHYCVHSSFDTSLLPFHSYHNQHGWSSPQLSDYWSGMYQ